MNEKSLDLSVLRTIFEDDVLEISNLLAEVAKTVTRVEDRLTEASERQEWTSAGKLLHEMKGVGASTGCVEVAYLCESTEADLAAHRYDRIPGRLQSLRSACNRLRVAIREASVREPA